jgi:hypothetical protein
MKIEKYITLNNIIVLAKETKVRKGISTTST